VQLFDWSTTARKVAVVGCYKQNVEIKKIMLKMTAAGLDARWESTTPRLNVTEGRRVLWRQKYSRRSLDFSDKDRA